MSRVRVRFGEAPRAADLEHVLVVVDDAEAVRAEQLAAGDHRVNRVTLFEILGHEVVARLAEAHLEHGG